MPKDIFGELRNSRRLITLKKVMEKYQLMSLNGLIK